MCGHYFYSEKAHGVLAEHMFAAHNEIPFVVEAGFEEQDWGSGGLYINFEFTGMTWTGDCYAGRFEAADYGVSCHFRYDRGSGDYELWDVAAPDGRFLPLPIFWRRASTVVFTKDDICQSPLQPQTSTLEH